MRGLGEQGEFLGARVEQWVQRVGGGPLVVADTVGNGGDTADDESGDGVQGVQRGICLRRKNRGCPAPVGESATALSAAFSESFRDPPAL